MFVHILVVGYGFMCINKWNGWGFSGVDWDVVAVRVVGCSRCGMWGALGYP